MEKIDQIMPLIWPDMRKLHIGTINKKRITGDSHPAVAVIQAQVPVNIIRDAISDDTESLPVFLKKIISRT